MKTIELIGWVFELIFLEALVDACIHRLKVEKKVIYGYAHHIYQIMLLGSYFCFGAFFESKIGVFPHTGWWQIFSPEMWWFILGFVMIRVGFFNLLFNTLANYKGKADGMGNTDIVDVLLSNLLRWLGLVIDKSIKKRDGKGFDCTYLLLIYNILTIGIAFLGCILLDKYVGY